MSVLRREAGTSTLGWRAARPLRIRVSMSAMGSVVVIIVNLPAGSFLPASLGHAGDFSGQRQLPETDPAQFEFAEIPARPAAAEAAVAMPAGQLRRLLGLLHGELFVTGDFSGSGHVSPRVLTPAWAGRRTAYPDVSAAPGPRRRSWRW